MTNIEKYNSIFKEVLNVISIEKDELKFGKLMAWDSIGHMNLVTNIETVYDIMLSSDDIMDFNSYQRGIEILKEKYHVEF